MNVIRAKLCFIGAVLTVLSGCASTTLEPIDRISLEMLSKAAARDVFFVTHHLPPGDDVLLFPPETRQILAERGNVALLIRGEVTPIDVQDYYLLVRPARSTFKEMLEGPRFSPMSLRLPQRCFIDRLPVSGAGPIERRILYLSEQSRLPQGERLEEGDILIAHGFPFFSH